MAGIADEGGAANEQAVGKVLGDEDPVTARRRRQSRMASRQGDGHCRASSSSSARVLAGTSAGRMECCTTSPATHPVSRSKWVRRGSNQAHPSRRPPPSEPSSRAQRVSPTGGRGRPRGCRGLARPPPPLDRGDVELGFLGDAEPDHVAGVRRVWLVGLPPAAAPRCGGHRRRPTAHLRARCRRPSLPRRGHRSGRHGRRPGCVRRGCSRRRWWRLSVVGRSAPRSRRRRSGRTRRLRCRWCRFVR